MIDIQSIKKMPILEIAKALGIKVKGRYAFCIFHLDQKNPSLCFYPETNTYHCFGCGVHGDNIKLVEATLKLSYKGALQWILKEFNIESTSTKSILPIKHYNNARIIQKNNISPEEFSANTSIYTWIIDHCNTVTQKIGIDYLSQHGIPLKFANKIGIKEINNPEQLYQSLVSEWGLETLFKSGLVHGEKNNPRGLIWHKYVLVFPFYRGDVVEYLQGRLFQNKIKYMNIRGITKVLYNRDCLSTLNQGDTIHLCEGVPDTIALLSKGIPAVGILGAQSFDKSWVDLFIKFNIVVLPDNDDGGRKFAARIESFFAERMKPVTIMSLAEGKDVAEMIAMMEGKNA